MCNSSSLPHNWYHIGTLSQTTYNWSLKYHLKELNNLLLVARVNKGVGEYQTLLHLVKNEHVKFFCLHLQFCKVLNTLHIVRCFEVRAQWIGSMKEEGIMKEFSAGGKDEAKK